MNYYVNYKPRSFSESRREFLFRKGLFEKFWDCCSAIHETFRCSVQDVIYSAVIIIKIEPSCVADFATGIFYILEEGHKRVVLKSLLKRMKI
jgi:hypothetical protein